MFITHDLATVKAIADKVVVMKNGRVVEQGPKLEMFKPPHHAYTDLFLSSVPKWTRTGLLIYSMNAELITSATLQLIRCNPTALLRW